MVGPSFSLLFYIKNKKKFRRTQNEELFFRRTSIGVKLNNQAHEPDLPFKPIPENYNLWKGHFSCEVFSWFHQNKSSSSNAKCVPLTSTKLLFGFCPNTVYRSLEILLKQARVDCCSCFVVGYYCNI